jgi:hypothetical protein
VIRRVSSALLERRNSPSAADPEGPTENVESLEEPDCERNVLDVLEHPNKERYPNQPIYLVKQEEYVSAVPFVRDVPKGELFLRSACPGRRYTKDHLKRGGLRWVRLTIHKYVTGRRPR